RSPHPPPEKRRGGSFGQGGIGPGAARIELHHAGRVGDCFDAGKREHDANEAAPVLPKAPVQWLQMSQRSAEMGETEQTKRNDDDGGWNGNQERETAGVFRSEKVEQTYEEDCRRRELFRMWNAKILKS